jgi:serine O-acetyltransferase
MIDFIRAYRKRDPAAKSFLEVLLLYPGPKAIFFHRISHCLYNCKLHFLARLVAEHSRLITGIEIHPGAKIGKRCVIDHGMGVVVGETAEIGDDCLLYQGVTLGGVDLNPIKRHATLRNNVIVGSGAKILGNIEIGDGAKVGANSVVTKSVLPGKTVVGIPAREL